MKEEAYKHIKIGLITVDHLYISGEFKKKSEYARDELQIGVNGCNVGGDPVHINIDPAFSNCAPLSIQLGEAEARALSGALISLLESRA